MSEILKIEKAVTANAVLPTGYYVGVVCGYVISLTYKNENYNVTIKDGIRGSAKVVLIITDKEISYEFLNN